MADDFGMAGGELVDLSHHRHRPGRCERDFGFAVRRKVD
jgi:hypothetical protein